MAQNIGNINMSLQDALTAERMGVQQQRASQFAQNMETFARMASMSDETLKENIEKVGEQNGFNVYRFNYKGDDKRYEGVMAQEVMETRPDAVTVKDGKLAVYYDKIGIEFKEVA